MACDESSARSAGPVWPAHAAAGDGGTVAGLLTAVGADAAEADQGLRETCHDLRQPIAGVLALAEAALTEPDVPREVRVCLEQIVQQAEWLAETIQNWLQTGQPDDPARPG
jgi:His Kinase A (phospho-acceptor) domain